jgi:hypothetical protein
MSRQNRRLAQPMLVLASAFLLLTSTLANADCGPGSPPECTCVIFPSEMEELFRRLKIGQVTLPLIDPPAQAGAVELLLAAEFYAPEAAAPLHIIATQPQLPIAHVTRPLPQPYVEPDPALSTPFSAHLIPEPNTFLLALLAISLFATRRQVRLR